MGQMHAPLKNPMFKKYISIQNVIKEAKRTWHRFPWVLSSAFVGVITSLILINAPSAVKNQFPFLPHIVLTSMLGLTLFLSIKVLGEEQQWPKAKLQVINLIGLAFLIFYFLTWYPFETQFHRGGGGAKFFEFFLINVSFHLLVSFAPFILQKNRLNAFWQYNRILFMEINTAVLYSITLHIGLCIAIAAISNLFSIRIDEELYFSLGVIIFGVFNTWYFLSGIPPYILLLEEVDDHPRGLQILTQYILIPIATLYFLILYLYVGKIIFTWNLPKGWVSIFIITASMLGILALLLIHPLSQRKEGGWIKIYARNFYIAIFPLIGLLAIAIGRRVMDYGITEKRYFVIIFALWLFVMACYFTFSKKRNIKVIPITLSLLLFFSAWGPWGAGFISKKSQFNRLEKLLVANKVLVNNKVQKEHPKISFDDRKQISSIMWYFHQTHGFDEIKHWFGKDEEVHKKGYVDVLRMMGIEYIHHRTRRNEEWFSYNANYNTYKGGAINIKGYDYLLEFSSTVYSQKRTLLDLKEENLQVIYDSHATRPFQIVSEGKEPLTFEFISLVEQMREKYGDNKHGLDLNDLVLESESGWIKAKIFLQTIHGSLPQGQKAKLSSFSGKLLIEIKE